jgi:hypothetical protein
MSGARTAGAKANFFCFFLRWFFRGGDAVLQGVFENLVCSVMVICGEVVVECVVNVVC